MSEFSASKLKRFIHFAYASSRLPSTDKEYRDRRIRMMIQPYDDVVTRINCLFPRADTYISLFLYLIYLLPFKAEIILYEKQSAN